MGLNSSRTMLSFKSVRNLTLQHMCERFFTRTPTLVPINLLFPASTPTVSHRSHHSLVFPSPYNLSFVKLLLLPYIHLLPPYTTKPLFSSPTTLTLLLLHHISANAPFHFLSSLLFLIALLSSFPSSGISHTVPSSSLRHPSALLINRERHVQLSSAGSQSYQMAPGRTQTSALPNSAQTALRRICSCVNSLCLKIPAM